MGIRRTLKPYLVREADVSSTKCINNALLTPLSLQSKQLQADYVSSHQKCRERRGSVWLLVSQKAFKEIRNEMRCRSHRQWLEQEWPRAHGVRHKATTSHWATGKMGIWGKGRHSATQPADKKLMGKPWTYCRPYWNPKPVYQDTREFNQKWDVKVRSQLINTLIFLVKGAPMKGRVKYSPDNLT